MFSHILLAEKVWITRLRGFDSSRLPIWSEVDIEVCAELVMQNKESFTTFLTNLSHTDLDKLIFYTNSKGEEFKNPVRDIRNLAFGPPEFVKATGNRNKYVCVS
ncbi:hypothetical protein ACQKKK_11685 [Peribacillus sp. NPDC006672]|uniref:hypothetical protein n=1 Tax=Peribacillus sp. NPDC006672 TaxID=3390606 RepID=UPI003CFFA2C6